VSDAISIGDPPPGRIDADFAWAPSPTSILDLTVRNPDDGPLARPVNVKVESMPNALPAVGTLTVGGVPLEAQGSLRAEAVTNAGGLATFTALPRAAYRALLLPTDESGAVTMVGVDLSQGGEREARRVRLARKVLLSGRLVPAARAAGASVIALDPSADPAAAVPSAVADGDGRYTLALNPGPNRQYRLFVEPVLARSLPRVSLGTISAPAMDTMLDDRFVPEGRAITGVVTLDGQPLAGAVVQAYCFGDGPECLAATSVATDRIRPAGEAVSGPTGAFRLVVPDPATSN